MSLKDIVNAFRADTKTQMDVLEAVAILQKLRAETIQANDKLQAIADGGSFDTIDAELKSSLITTRNIVKNTALAFQAETPTDLLEGHVSRTCMSCGQSEMLEVGSGEAVEE